MESKGNSCTTANPLRTADFDYDLPLELIAQAPLPERSLSRMMVVHRETGELEHRHVTDLPEYLREGDLLVVNDTRVVPARVFGHWEDTGGRVELLLLEEMSPGLWESFCRSSRRPREGMLLSVASGKLAGEVLGQADDGRIVIRFTGAVSVGEVLEEEGVPPVPPYIRRPGNDPRLVEMDRERYQTVYADKPGAVAAPTAGLHFTDEMLTDLERCGVSRTAVTLHVGPGTFRPVREALVRDHIMEQERFEVTGQAAAAVTQTRNKGGRIVAVGSTSVRVLETVGAKNGLVTPGSGRTPLFIYPPYDFRIVDALLTNFHLPKSSLLLMVCALAEAGAGCEKRGSSGISLVLSAYQEAIRQQYRFYSYGDCMLMIEKKAARGLDFGVNGM